MFPYRVRLALTGSITALALMGCAGPPTAAPAQHDRGATLVDHRPASTLRVGLTEWSIETSATQLRPGRVTLIVTNAGTTEHNLYVRSEQRTWHTPDLEPGDRARLQFWATVGEHFKMWCDIPGHAEQGMRTTISAAGKSG